MAFDVLDTISLYRSRGMLQCRLCQTALVFELSQIKATLEYRIIGGEVVIVGGMESFWNVDNRGSWNRKGVVENGLD